MDVQHLHLCGVNLFPTMSVGTRFFLCAASGDDVSTRSSSYLQTNVFLVPFFNSLHVRYLRAVILILKACHQHKS